MTGQLHGLFAACVSVAHVVVLATTQDQLNEAVFQSEVVSLVQVTFKASHRWSPTQLLNTDKRTWLDDPKLRRRLADLLHPQEEEEQLVADQPVELNMARVVDDENGGPLAKELSQILQGNSSGRSHHDEALTSQAPTLASQPTGAPTQAEGASREEEDAKRLADFEKAERKHKIYRQRLQDEAERRRQEATHTADGQVPLTAEQAAKKAAADRRYWEEVAREAKFRADEDLRAKREAEDSMKKAAEEEAKWAAVTGQDYSHEESVAQEDASFEDIDAEIAREEAETESRKQAEAEAEGARQKAEMEALKKSEAEAEAARQKAEAEAQRRAEAEAEAMRQKAALEARAATEAQQLAEAEAARKHAEADALAARQEAHAEAQARAAAQEAQRRAEAAAEAARLKAEAEAAARVEAKARAEAAEEARRKAEAAAEQAQKHADAEAQAEAQAKAEVAKIWQKAEEQRAIAVREAREAAKTQAKMKQEAEKARKRAESEAAARKKAEEEARAARRQEKAEADAKQQAKEQAAFEHAKQLAEEEAAAAMRDAEKSIRKRAMAVIESEETVKAEQAHHRAQEEAKRVAEQEAKRRAEEEARDRAAAERAQAEKAAQEARRQAEEESQRLKQEEERRQAVEEARKKAEQEAKAEADRRAEETQHRLEEEQRKLEEERQKAQKAEEERHKLEQEKQQLEEENRRRSEEEAKRRAEEEAKQQAEEEAKRRAEEEARQRAEQQARREAKRKAEEEARRQAEAKARAEAEAEKARWEARRLKAEADSAEVKNIVNSWEQARVCMSPEELESSLEETKTAVLHGLPHWHEPEVPSQLEDVTLAFLIQASWEEQLKVLRRTFDLLYSPKDLFLYTVDRERLETQKVVQILPNPLPDNVVVRQSAHSAYYVWPRVEIVLDGLRTLLLQEKKWDFAVHLSESDYPLHSLSWIRKSFAMQRNTNFIHLIPRCSRAGDTGLDMKRDEWYWWTQDDALASCGSDTDVTTVDGIKFPMQHLEKGGFRFAHGAEWMAVTRELVKYALSPDLLPYRKMIGMHVGADEIFWQSLVLNIPGFKQNISQQGWYIRWGHGKTDHSPDTLTKAYEDDILKNRQRFFFMRKVSEESLSLLDDIASLDAGTDVAPGPAQVEQWEEWSKGMVPCDEVANRQQQQAAVHMRGWQGTKSRKQLLEVYKWYMQSQ